MSGSMQTAASAAWTSVASRMSGVPRGSVGTVKTVRTISVCEKDSLVGGGDDDAIDITALVPLGAYTLGSLRAELAYWARIFSDHCLLLHVLLDDSTDVGRADGLKKQAMDLHRDWRSYVRRYQLQFSPVNDDASLALSGQDILVPLPVTGNPGDFLHGGPAYLAAQALVVRTTALKEQVLARIRAGDWVGAVYESFVLEILGEVRYFATRILDRQQPSPSEEVIYWNEHNRAHALLFRQLLDPSSEADYVQSQEAADMAGDLAEAQAEGGDDANLVALSALLARKMLEYNRSVEQQLAAAHEVPQVVSAAMQGRRFSAGALRTVAPPLLVSHTVIELEYGIAVLASLGYDIEAEAATYGINANHLDAASFRNILQRSS